MAITAGCFARSSRPRLPRPRSGRRVRTGFRTSSWPKAEYPDHFDLLQHLLVNYSPFMSWAFPRSLFFTYGLRFDEQLTVCEDWDVILRGSLICGVDDVPHLTVHLPALAGRRVLVHQAQP